LSPIAPVPTSYQPAKANAHAYLAGFAVEVRSDDVDADYFEDVFEAAEGFYVVVVFVDIKCVAAAYKKPVEAFEQGILLVSSPLK